MASELGTAINALEFIPVSERAAIAAGTSTYDCTDDLNAALAHASENQFKLKIPGGKYTITDTLSIVKPGSTFFSAHVEGDGAGNNASFNYCTLIDATSFTDRPALNIQFARNVVVKGLRVAGGGKQISGAISSIGDLTYDYDYVGSSRDDRYSPYCAIAIDAGLGSTPPGGGYPSMTYRGLTGGSQNIILQDLEIDGFVVGLMISPDGDTQQADVIRLDNPRIRNVKVAIASGQDQANCVVVSGGDISYCRTAFDSLEYGEQTGKDVLFLGTQFVAMFEMISHSPGYGSATFIGGYAESVHRLGQVGIGQSVIAVPLSLDNFSMRLLSSADGNICPILLEASAPVIWRGGYITRSDVSMDACHVTGNPAMFHGTLMRMVNRHRPFVGNGVALDAPAILRNCRIIDGSAAVTYGREARRAALSGRFSASTHEPVQHVGSGAYAYLPGVSDTHQLSAGVLSNVVFSATQLTFDDTDAAGCYVVGDLIYWLMNEIGKSLVQHRVLAAKVTAISAPTVTCDLLYDRSYYDETDTAGPIRIGVHEWAPEVALVGDLTSGSPAVANVSPTTIIQVGDWIKSDSGIAAKTRVTGVSGTDITLSRNATASVLAAPLYFGRLASVI